MLDICPALVMSLILDNMSPPGPPNSTINVKNGVVVEYSPTFLQRALWIRTDGGGLGQISNSPNSLQAF
eukprot:m.131831 g.131831  ORF g.131831 m.131831 type:complete len:69 (+) comp14636_c0_seq10:1705-1911(+)